MMNPLVIDLNPIIEWLMTPIGGTQLNVGVVIALLIIFYILATSSSKKGWW